MFILCCIAMAWYAWYESTPLLQPLTKTTEHESRPTGINIDYFEFTGFDGNTVKACIVKGKDKSEFSPRQSRVYDLLKLRGKLQNLESKPGVVLLATSWDNGIETSMPYAESLTSAGFTCVLWDPRGVDNVREYCTYGLHEAGDVPLLIDAIEEKTGNAQPISAFGRGFGASMLMLATPKDERIRSLVSADNFCILRTALLDALQDEMSKPLSYAALWLIDMGVQARAGYRSFDVVPVDAARQISVPVMLVCADEYFFASLNDSVKIYDALSIAPDKRFLYVPREESEPYGTTQREHVVVHELKNGELKEQHFMLNVYDGDDELMANIAEWLPEYTMPPLPKVLMNEVRTNHNRY